MHPTRRATLAGLAAGAVATPAAAAPARLDRLRLVTLRTPEGATTTLGAALTPGRAAVVAFWATWCAPCLTEAQRLNAIRERAGRNRLDVVGLNIDRAPEEAKIAAFLARSGATFTQLRADAAAWRAFGNGRTVSLPRVYVFAADGRDLYGFNRLLPGVSDAAVDRAIAQALDG
jgi:thiol-disulfide isomerase/thioredoxin